MRRGYRCAAKPTTELRLALVCYGGVSLAVYMHGVTKELHKLICAARAFDKDPNNNPFPNADGSRLFRGAASASTRPAAPSCP